MEEEIFEAVIDPHVYDRALLHHLLILGEVQSLNAIRIYLIFLSLLDYSVTYIDGPRHGQKETMATVTNNGKLRFTYSEAEQTYGISRSAFYKAIRYLIVRGLIEVTKRGGGGGNMYAICKPIALESVSHRITAAKERAHEREFAAFVQEHMRMGL